MDVLATNTGERLTSLEANQKDLHDCLQKFQETTAKSLNQILKSLASQTEKSSATPKATSAGGDTTIHAWKTAVNLLETQLESKNRALEDHEHLRQILEATTGEKQNLEDQFAELEKDRDKNKHEKELLLQKLEALGAKTEERVKLEFPSNETIIHNLLVSQIEFYFSNHHLKRDKPLMEKLCAAPDVGYISFQEVTHFPKVRPLGQTNEVVEKAVLASKFLQMREVGGKVIVGRANFTPPKTQEFPFRRTVFVYGIPPVKAHDENWIREQFCCFGSISKVKFDSGKHSLPRKVGTCLLSKEQERVVKLRLRDSNHSEYNFCNHIPPGQQQTYFCHGCTKLKNFKDGYYIWKGWQDRQYNAQHGPQSLFCVQCAAKKAENNLKSFQSRPNGVYTNNDDIKELFGIDQQQFDEENMLANFRTCLVVFESQRQASKCVFVRSRLGIEGCFATHFHNYTRHKKEICNGGVGGDKTPSVIGEAPPDMVAQDSDMWRLIPQRKGMVPQRSSGAIEQNARHRRDRFAINPLAPPKMKRHQSTPELQQARGNKRFARPR